MIRDIIKWLAEHSPFYVKIRDMNCGEKDAGSKPAVEAGIRIRF